MTQFDQRGQYNSGTQQNAGGDIHNQGSSFSSTTTTIDSPADLARYLSQLQTTVTEMAATNILPEEIGIDVNAALAKTTLQVKQPAPEKKKLLDYLTTAKTLIESATAASALIPAIITAITAVQKLF